MKMLRSIKCEYLEWEFKCPKDWNDLAETEDKNVRFCGACHSEVYFSSDDEQILEWAKEGKCTAFDYPDPDQPGVLMGSLTLGEYTESERKRLSALKIKQIKTRIEQYGESPEILNRLANLYEVLGDNKQANFLRGRASA